jgi:CRISPR-associated protein Csm5
MSPIHIGCGEVYEPTSFRVDSDKGKLYPFDPIDLIDSLDESGRKALDTASSGDNLLTIIQEIARLADVAKVPSLSSVDMATGLRKHYDTVMKMSTYKKEEVINQFTLERTAYNPNGAFPYIPGSSIKGAIRTAYLNFKNGGQPCQIDDMRKINQVSKELEKHLLNGSFEDDPFRLLKVPDLLPVEPPSTRLIYAVNMRKKGGAGKGPFQILETIAHGSVFEGVLSLSQPPKGAKVKPLPAIKDLLLCLNSFCLDRYQEDKEVMAAINADSFTKEIGGRIVKFKNAIQEKTAFLVRLGRHCGAESHTFDGVRKIKILKAPEPQSSATTIWLAAEDKKADKGVPFGWAVLEMLPLDCGVAVCSDHLRTERAAEAEARRAEASLKAEAEAKRKVAEEDRLQRVTEKKRQIEEKESRQRAEWESLSEEERLIRTPALPNVTEQQVVDCFNKLDSLSSPHKEKLAGSIKQYYIITGKWEGGSKKQIEKVKKLKTILG